MEDKVLKPRSRGSKNNPITPNTRITATRQSTTSTLINKNRQLTSDELSKYKKEEEQTDQNWYAKEGDTTEETPEKAFLGDQKEFAAFEDDLEKINRARKMGTVYRRRKSQKAQALEKDQTRWEQNRIENAGMGGFDRVETVVDNEESSNVRLLVLDTKPSFLEDKDVATQQQTVISVVKDPNSNLAVIAKKGSALLHQIRKQKDTEKAVHRDRASKGTRQESLIKQQNLMCGLESGKPHSEVKPENVDYKASASYSTLRAQDEAAASNFAREKSLRQQREFLPIFAVRDSLLRVVRDHQVVVVVGETGSGKTTQLAQYLLEDGFSEYGLIGCTQPRRVAAMSVAKRVARERNVVLGAEVGYAIRFEDCTSKETRIKYLTDGVLLREALRSSDLEDYSVVIMDEAHERSLHTDILLGLLRDVCRRRADLKLIVTSATLDSERFAGFFGGVPIFKVPGRTFPVDILFSKSVCEDYLESAVKQILTIHLTQSDGDILVFMTGQEDIEATCAMALKRLAKLEATRPLLMLPIYSALPSDLQARVFAKAPAGTRKCVVATNIAETSITLDGIKYVVDTGFCKLKVFIPRIGMDSLQVTPISRANAEQRSGRAGRTAAGSAYRMYTLMSYNFEMLPSSVPEIQRTNLGNVVLLLKSLGVKDLLKFEFMDPPPEANILNSMFQLWVLGALGNDGELTDLGKCMAEFPLDPALSKMLVFSALLGCSEEVMTIVSVLSAPSIFYRPNDRASESDATREKFTVPESDHLTLLRVYEIWSKKNFAEKWCQEHFVHYKAMRRVREVRAQLEDIMNQQRLPLVSCGFDYDLVRKSICSAYFHHSAKMKGIGQYTNLRNRMPCHLHPSSGLYGLGYTPEYVVYHELIFTSREYMRTVTAVEPKWLAELGPMFFSLRRNKKDAALSLHNVPKSDTIVFRKTAMLKSLDGSDSGALKTSALAKPLGQGEEEVTVQRIETKGGLRKGGLKEQNGAGSSESVELIEKRQKEGDFSREGSNAISTGKRKKRRVFHF